MVLGTSSPQPEAESQETPLPLSSAVSSNTTGSSMSVPQASNQKSSDLVADNTSNQASRTPTAEDFSQYEKYKDYKTPLFGDMVVGTGAETAQGKTVVVNYRGWLTNGTIFDESYARNQPFAFVIGQNRVISGWETGLLGMKVGGKRRLIVPPAVGYGDQKVGSIPSNSLLIFDVELLEVK